MTGFRETHRYLRLHIQPTGTVLRVSCAYIRMLEEAPEGGTYITVADQASTRHVREDIETITALLEAGTVRYDVELPPA